MQRYIFVGSVDCSAYCLRALLAMGVNIVDIMCPYKDVSKFNSDYFDLGEVAKGFGKDVCCFKRRQDEIGAHPFPRSIENLKALATFRGATAGVEYAEAFMVLKEIW